MEERTRRTISSVLAFRVAVYGATLGVRDRHLSSNLVPVLGIDRTRFVTVNLHPARVRARRRKDPVLAFDAANATVGFRCAVRLINLLTGRVLRFRYLRHDSDLLVHYVRFFFNGRVVFAGIGDRFRFVYRHLCLAMAISPFLRVFRLPRLYFYFLNVVPGAKHLHARLFFFRLGRFVFCIRVSFGYHDAFFCIFRLLCYCRLRGFYVSEYGSDKGLFVFPLFFMRLFCFNDVILIRRVAFCFRHVNRLAAFRAREVKRRNGPLSLFVVYGLLLRYVGPLSGRVSGFQFLRRFLRAFVTGAFFYNVLFRRFVFEGCRDEGGFAFVNGGEGLVSVAICRRFNFGNLEDSVLPI